MLPCSNHLYAFARLIRRLVLFLRFLRALAVLLTQIVPGCLWKVPWERNNGGLLAVCWGASLATRAYIQYDMGQVVGFFCRDVCACHSTLFCIFLVCFFMSQLLSRACVCRSCVSYYVNTLRTSGDMLPQPGGFVLCEAGFYGLTEKKGASRWGIYLFEFFPLASGEVECSFAHSHACFYQQ